MRSSNIFIVLLSSLLVCCNLNTSESLFDGLKNNQEKVFIVSHRGNWRNAPENSILAIQNSIKMGVDMVEIDVRETKDGKLILMHDETLDRTTNGTGYVSDWILSDLKKLNLKDHLGNLTPYKIPTLREALGVSKDKIWVNLDNKNDSNFDKCFQVITETKAEKQILIKGAKTLSEVQSEFESYLDRIRFMPIVNLSESNFRSIVREYVSSDNPPIAIEFIIPSDTISFIQEFKSLRELGINVWVNSLWPDMCGGHHDDAAINDIRTYDWYIENGINIIQTDRPQLLMKYLENRKIRK